MAEQQNQSNMPPSSMLNRVTDDFIFSLMNYILLLAAFIIFVLLELIKVRFNFWEWWYGGSWINIVTNMFLQALILFPMTNEGERIGLKTTRYTTTKGVLQELLKRVRLYGHTNKFQTYLKKYNQKRCEEWLEEQLGSVGLSMYDGRKMLSIHQIKATAELNTEQSKKLDWLAKHSCPIKPVTVGDLYSVLPMKGNQNALTINKGWEKFKVIFPRILIAAAGTTLITMMIMEVKEETTLMVVITVMMKLFTVFTNTLFGFLGGRRISVELLPLVFDNRISLIKGFAIDNRYFDEYEITIAKADEGKEDTLSGELDNGHYQPEQTGSSGNE